MPEEDDDEYFFLGTPLQEEEESHAGQRRKVIQDPSTVKQLPLWKQVRQCDVLSASAGPCSAWQHHTVAVTPCLTP